MNDNEFNLVWEQVSEETDIVRNTSCRVLWRVYYHADMSVAVCNWYLVRVDFELGGLRSDLSVPFALGLPHSSDAVIVHHYTAAITWGQEQANQAKRILENLKKQAEDNAENSKKGTR